LAQHRADASGPAPECSTTSPPGAFHRRGVNGATGHGATAPTARVRGETGVPPPPAAGSGPAEFSADLPKVSVTCDTKQLRRIAPDGPFRARCLGKISWDPGTRQLAISPVLAIFL
jgi:hypothetical protein